MTSSTRPTPLDADAFLAAAERVDDGTSFFACNALKRAQCERTNTPEYQLLRDHFMPLPTEADFDDHEPAPWWGGEGDDPARVLALLLCYWMAKDGAK